MATPKKDLELLKQNKITGDMLAKVIFTFEKRAVDWDIKFSELYYKNKKNKKGEYLQEMMKAADSREMYKERVNNMFDKLKAVSIQKRTYEKEYKENIPESHYNFDLPLDDLRMYDSSKMKNFNVTSKEVIDTAYSRYGNKYKRIKYTVITNQYYLYYQVGDMEFYKEIYETERTDDLSKSDDIVKDKYQDIDIEPYNKNADISPYDELYKDSILLSYQFCKKVYFKFLNGELEII